MKGSLARRPYREVGEQYRKPLTLRRTAHRPDNMVRRRREWAKPNQRPSSPVDGHLKAKHTVVHRDPQPEIGGVARKRTRCPVGAADRQDAAEHCLAVGYLDARLEP